MKHFLKRRWYLLVCALFYSASLIRNLIMRDWTLSKSDLGIVTMYAILLFILYVKDRDREDK